MSRGRVAAPRRHSLRRVAKRRAPAALRSRAPKLATRGGSAKMTTDHATIRRWVEARGGHPASVKRSAKARQPAGILRIDFPGFSGARSLKKISWAEFFEVFDERRLAFLYQDRTAGGKQSRFNKLVCRK